MREREIECVCERVKRVREYERRKIEMERGTVEELKMRHYHLFMSEIEASFLFVSHLYFASDGYDRA